MHHPFILMVIRVYGVNGVVFSKQLVIEKRQKTLIFLHKDVDLPPRAEGSGWATNLRREGE